MKKILSVILMICILFSVAGCSLPANIPSAAQPTDAVFMIENYDLQITADSTFQEKTAGSYDLQITNGSTYISIMAYKYIDLPEDITPLNVYAMQNEDLFSKRTSVSTIEETQTQTLSNSSIIHGLFSAEKDGVKNYYASYLVDFPDEETFAWVLVTAMPSYLENNKDFLHNIVCSLTTVG